MDAEDYLMLLGIAFRDLESSIVSYKNNPDVKVCKLSVAYHVFSYTQLVYALYERLQAEKKIDSKVLKTFFKTGPEATRLVFQYANEMKHKKFNGIEVGTNWDGLTSKPANPILPERYKRNDQRINAVELIDKSRSEIQDFMVKNGYKL